VLAAREAREQDKRAKGLPTLPSTIADERATNPFLRATEPAVRAAAQAHAGRALDDAVAVFAELRAWKNAFR
jgi:hydroxyacylglutathione hydrolase